METFFVYLILILAAILFRSQAFEQQVLRCPDRSALQGLSHAVCGVATDTKYAEEYVRPIAASYEADGSVFLLWERKAQYAREGEKHSEDICGVTYVKKDTEHKASVIATFRQPSPVCCSIVVCCTLR
jgi:hypothetical protein